MLGVHVAMRGGCIWLEPEPAKVAKWLGDVRGAAPARLLTSPQLPPLLPFMAPSARHTASHLLHFCYHRFQIVFTLKLVVQRNCIEQEPPLHRGGR